MNANDLPKSGQKWCWWHHGRNLAQNENRNPVAEGFTHWTSQSHRFFFTWLPLRHLSRGCFFVVRRRAKGHAAGGGFQVWRPPWFWRGFDVFDRIASAFPCWFAPRRCSKTSCERVGVVPTDSGGRYGLWVRLGVVSNTYPHLNPNKPLHDSFSVQALIARQLLSGWLPWQQKQWQACGCCCAAIGIFAQVLVSRI